MPIPTHHREGKKKSNFALKIKTLLSFVKVTMWFTIYLATNLVATIYNIFGETGRRLADRFREHIGYVKSTNLTQLTGNHFNLPEHALSNMKVTVLEKCKENNPA